MHRKSMHMIDLLFAWWMIRLGKQAYQGGQAAISKDKFSQYLNATFTH